MVKKILNKAIIVLLFILFIFFVYSNSVYAHIDVEEKIFSTASLDDDFSSDRVLVVLNKKASHSEYLYTRNDFYKYGCLDVKDLIYDITLATDNEIEDKLKKK